MIEWEARTEGSICYVTGTVRWGGKTLSRTEAFSTKHTAGYYVVEVLMITVRSIRLTILEALNIW